MLEAGVPCSQWSSSVALFCFSPFPEKGMGSLSASDVSVSELTSVL